MSYTGKGGTIKLWVPVPISQARKHRLSSQGTKAFIQQGRGPPTTTRELETLFKKRLNILQEKFRAGETTDSLLIALSNVRNFLGVIDSHNFKPNKSFLAQAKRQLNQIKGADQRRAALTSAMDLALGQKSRAYHSAKHFLKPTSKRIKAARAALLQAGLAVETPMLETKGKELFARSGKSIYQSNIKIRDVKEQAIQFLIKMHKAGVTHNHLHFGNFVVSNGKLVLIDLSKAKLYSAPPKTRAEFVKRFSRDIDDIARGIENLYGDFSPLPSLMKTIKFVLKEYSKQSPTFGATPTMIYKESLKRWN